MLKAGPKRVVPVKFPLLSTRTRPIHNLQSLPEAGAPSDRWLPLPPTPLPLGTGRDGSKLLEGETNLETRCAVRSNLFASVLCWVDVSDRKSPSRKESVVSRSHSAPPNRTELVRDALGAARGPHAGQLVRGDVELAWDVLRKELL